MTDLQKLFESELLSSETKTQIKEAFDAAQKAIREELEVSFAKKLVADKQQMNIKLVSVIDEAVSNEIGELREDIANARTLEVRYAKKLEEFKSEYTQKMNEAMNSVIGAYVQKEFKELRADLLEAKKNTVLSRIFEQFADEFRKLGLTPSEKELVEQLQATTVRLNAAEEHLNVAARSAKMEGLLSNLTGNKRDVMRVILENVSEDKLESTYNAVLDDVLKEETTAPAAKPLTESAKTDAPTGRTVLVNGNAKLVESSGSEVEELQRLAGIQKRK